MSRRTRHIQLPTRENLIQHLESEGEAIFFLNHAAGAILLALATALATGVEQELAKVCFAFAESQKTQIDQQLTDLDRQKEV